MHVPTTTTPPLTAPLLARRPPAQETWMVADGKLTPHGQTNLRAAGAKEAAKFEVQEETTDAYGNIIKVRAGGGVVMGG